MLCVLMAMYATRITETRVMRWQWIDWPARRFTIPGQYTKNGELNTLPLTPLAELVLRTYAVSQQAKNKSQVFLFPGNKRQPISRTTANNWVKQISQAAWRAHDIRKLARAIWSHQGVEQWLGERLINHKQKGLDAVYNQAEIQQRLDVALGNYHALFYAHDFVISVPRQCRDHIKATLRPVPHTTRHRA
jgi:integrase